MTRGLALVVISGVLHAPALVYAQAAPDAPAGWDPATFYAHLIEDTVVIRRQQIAAIEAGRRAARTSRALRSPSLATANAATAVDVAHAAISTSVAGADAGVTVSPLALAGFLDAPIQVPITVAALKDGVARLQLGVTWQRVAPHGSQGEACQLDESAIRRVPDDIKPAYIAVCSGVPAVGLPPTNVEDGSEQIVLEVRQACGLAPGPVMTLGRALLWISHGLRALRERYAKRAEAPREAIAALDRILPANLDVLAKARLLAPDACSANDVDALTREAARDAWEAGHTRVGLSLRSDLFDRRFGFNPDPKSPLSAGRLRDGEVRVELAYARRGSELVVGVGYGQARASLDSELVAYVSPSISLAWTVASLSGQSLYDANNRLRLVNATPPPRLVVGVDAQAQYAPSPPSTQVASLQKLSITPFVDFRFTDTLAVRLGVPLDAELAMRKADMANGIAAKQDRQWSVPAFVTTVLKL